MTKWKKYWNNNVVAKYFAIVVVGLCAGLALSGVLHVLMNNAQVRQQVEQQIATHPQNVQQTTRRSNERHVAQRAAARPLVRARQQVADTQSRNSRPVSQWIGKWFHVYNYDDLFLRVLNKLGVFVLLFSRPWCPGCRIVEKYFNDHNYPNVNYVYVHPCF